MTAPTRFLGLNIKGTPAMRAKAVAHDLAVLHRKASVGVVQEYRWPWYWRVVVAARDAAAERDVWATYPGMLTALRRPVYAGQAVMWARRRWQVKGKRQRLMHKGVARVSEDRRLRGALLRDRKAREAGKRVDLRCWFGTGHAVVGGDQDDDGKLRRSILADDLLAMDLFLLELKRTGWPIVLQLDLNIRPGGWAYPELLRIVERHGGRIYGEHGVEYLLVIDGRKAKVRVHDDWRVPVSQLRTDHEGRGITFTLATR